SPVPQGAATWMVAEDVEAKGQPGSQGSAEPNRFQTGRDGRDPALLAHVPDDGHVRNRRLDGYRSIGTDGQRLRCGQDSRSATGTQHGCSYICALCRPPCQWTLPAVL